LVVGAANGCQYLPVDERLVTCPHHVIGYAVDFTCGAVTIGPAEADIGFMTCVDMCGNGTCALGTFYFITGVWTSSVAAFRMLVAT
jgi:hypothetical protein